MTIIKKKRNKSSLPSFNSNLSELLDIDRFFDEPFFESSLFNNRIFTRVPATNIIEKEDEFVVELAAPGMSKKDFMVDINNNTLEIKVEKEEEANEENQRYARKEYDYTAFYRSFNLPEAIQADKIKAEYEDGLLLVHLPKTPEAKRKPIKQIVVT